MSSNLQLPNEVYVCEELKELMPIFLKNRIKDCDNLIDYVSKNDWEKISRLGHLLKGTCGGYGFEELGHLGAEIELLAQKKDSKILIKIAQIIKENIYSVKILYN